MKKIIYYIIQKEIIIIRIRYKVKKNAVIFVQLSSNVHYIEQYLQIFQQTYRHKENWIKVVSMLIGILYVKDD